MKKIQKLLFGMILISISSSIAAFEFIPFKITIFNETSETVRVMSIKFLGVMSSNVPINVNINSGESKTINLPARLRGFCVESFSYIPSLSTNEPGYIRFARPLCNLQQIVITPTGISTLSQRIQMP